MSVENPLGINVTNDVISIESELPDSLQPVMLHTLDIGKTKEALNKAGAGEVAIFFPVHKAPEGLGVVMAGIQILRPDLDVMTVYRAARVLTSEEDQAAGFRRNLYVNSSPVNAGRLVRVGDHIDSETAEVRYGVIDNPYVNDILAPDSRLISKLKDSGETILSNMAEMYDGIADIWEEHFNELISHSSSIGQRLLFVPVTIPTELFSKVGNSADDVYTLTKARTVKRSKVDKKAGIVDAWKETMVDILPGEQQLKLSYTKFGDAVETLDSYVNAYATSYLRTMGGVNRLVKLPFRHFGEADIPDLLISIAGLTGGELPRSASGKLEPILQLYCEQPELDSAEYEDVKKDYYLRYLMFESLRIKTIADKGYSDEKNRAIMSSILDLIYYVGVDFDRTEMSRHWTKLTRSAGTVDTFLTRLDFRVKEIVEDDGTPSYSIQIGGTKVKMLVGQSNVTLEEIE